MSNNRVENRTVALVDVDDTLITGLLTLDPDKKDDCDVEKIKIKLRGNDLQGNPVLNVPFINALMAANIKDIYLFTDMTFRHITMLERLALISVLSEFGFRVHGVITPADLGAHLPLKELKEFHESKEIAATLEKIRDSKVDRQISDAVFSVEKDIKKSGTVNIDSQELTQELKRIAGGPGDYLFHTANLMLNGTYKALKNSSLSNKLVLGSAFEKAKRAMHDSLETLMKTNSDLSFAREFGDIQVLMERMVHVKAMLLRQFIMHRHPSFSRVVVADDRTDVMIAIELEKEKAIAKSAQIDITTVFVSKKLKNQTDYINELTRGQIIDACEEYKSYLEKEISNSKADVALARQKKSAVESMLASLSFPDKTNQLKEFQKKFREYRALIERHRDSAAMRFLKIITTILSLGFAHFCFGIFNVKGKEFTSKMDPLLARPIFVATAS